MKKGGVCKKDKLAGTVWEGEQAYFSLSPAYDLVSTALVIRNEPGQLSLSINGTRNRIAKKDFISLAYGLLLTEKQTANFYNRLTRHLNEAVWWIKNSFLPEDQKEKLQQILLERIKALNL